jgi:hypothetical protein
MRETRKSPHVGRPSPLIRRCLILTQDQYDEMIALARKNDSSISRMMRLAVNKYLALERVNVV